MGKTRILIALALALAGAPAFAEVVAYPPAPGLVTSHDLAVEADGTRVFTERFQSTMDLRQLPDWFLSEPYTRVPQVVAVASFSVSGPVSVAVTAREPIRRFTIRPLSRNIEATVEGNVLRFRLAGPVKLYVEVNDLEPLCLFADPVETSRPKPGSPGVIYFGPGVHHPGLITLKDGDTVYIAGGAVVYGGLRGSPKNVRVVGRGILDGAYQYRLVLLEGASNVEFEGVTLRNGQGWTNTLVGCRDVTYRNVKVISFGPSGDGINPVGSRDVLIEDCFLRCTDDCVAIKAPERSHVVLNVRVRRSTMIGYAFSDGVTIGFETNGPEVRNVHVSDCDILIARGGSRVDGHSAFSIIADGPARIGDVLFEDVRVEERVEKKLFEIQVTDGTKYGHDPPGHVAGVRLRNVSWATERPIVLAGHGEGHLVEDVVFERCTVAGRPLTAESGLVRTNAFVRNVRFE
jgi:hypothetical protein